ncbi:TetR/AcrR family transcriptional regulator [Plantactinospora solaniradicis]|uniref:TetR/AcrR family transcriptional regulator n=1 Tax=Plantactinospora solaniradicis TaxID=1723736 RepID=A0ABW1K9X0_9ACTN
MASTSKDTGRQRRLDPDKIAESALAIADAEGLSTVTVRRLAQHHDVTPMALYRHFRDKDELLDAVAERLFAAVVLPEPSDAPWHEQMQDLLAAILAALSPHPNAAGLTLHRIFASEPGLTVAERALALLAEAGFSADQAAEIGSQVIGSLIAIVTPEPGTTENPDPEARDEQFRAKRAALAALSPRRYPHVVAAAETLVHCASGRRDHALAVHLIVAGVRAVRPTNSPATTGA